MSSFLNSRMFLLDRPKSRGDVSVFLAFIEEVESVIQPLLFSDNAIDLLILASANEIFHWSELEDKAFGEVCWEVNLILECHETANT
jgi:hypothetical protein